MPPPKTDRSLERRDANDQPRDAVVRAAQGPADGQFTQYTLERATSKVIRQSITRLKKATTSPDLMTVLDALQHQETRQPGSVVVRIGRLQRTVVLMGQDLLAGLHPQEELNLP